jgi:DNA adenine methylase
MSSKRILERRTGSFSPLRYPGGKGKLAKFMLALVKENSLSDGTYIEPYAGGAALAWELLLKGVVRRVEINDVSKPVHAFWSAALDQTDELCRSIADTPVTVQQWDRAKAIYAAADDHDDLELGFAFFFLNRTNRSGVLNGGIIGGRAQTGNYKIDARYNKDDLIDRISQIARLRNRIGLTRLDAMEFLRRGQERWRSSALIYLDPPYYDKGQSLYLNAYKPDDHQQVASSVLNLHIKNWIVSYDDVRPIHDLYGGTPKLQYSLNYSAHRKTRGAEVMFFSDSLKVPRMVKPLAEGARTNLLDPTDLASAVQA